MCFEYTPADDTPAEAFWTFSIPSQGITVPFLLAGLVNEPRVMFDRPSLGFGQVQVGVKGKLGFAIVNDEKVPFTFAFNKVGAPSCSCSAAANGMRPLLLGARAERGL